MEYLNKLSINIKKRNINDVILNEYFMKLLIMLYPVCPHICKQIFKDLYNENIVYAVFDNHKYGDYKAYLFKSIDKGKTWKNKEKKHSTSNLFNFKR